METYALPIFFAIAVGIIGAVILTETRLRNRKVNKVVPSRFNTTPEEREYFRQKAEYTRVHFEREILPNMSPEKREEYLSQKRDKEMEEEKLSLMTREQKLEYEDAKFQREVLPRLNPESRPVATYAALAIIAATLSSLNLKRSNHETL